ncbi:MAG: adenylosuccinate lyase family protein [Actinobacteria bacterium]|nr:adenylosuccinate lyase family protein [Actinomycetota bacterium]
MTSTAPTPGHAAPAGTTDECRHERGHITDSRFHGGRYATTVSRRIFCDVCRVQRWLDVEAALALAEAEVGLIPGEAAEEIASAARLQRVRLDGFEEGIKRTGHSLVALLHELQSACEGDAGEYVHRGATTQDIQDTAQTLEMRDVLDEVDAALVRVLRRLVPLARANRDTLMVGRTHAQPALPTTFGLKVAGWVDELLRHAERLEAMRPRVLVAELFGGVGTMAGFEGRGPELLRCFAGRLGLHAPDTGWHVARDRVAEYLATMAMIPATGARIADEVRTLARPEFGELTEIWEPGSIGSSTMPHKRNALSEACEQAVVLARLARTLAPLGLESMIGEHERDSRGLRLEWVAVADVSHYTLASLAALDQILGAFTVDRGRMADHAGTVAEAICSEALMLALSRRMGKQTAHAVVYEVSQQAQQEGASLRELLGARPDIAGHLGPDELDAVFDPARHLGCSAAMVDAVVAKAERRLDSTGAGAGVAVGSP